MNPENEKEAMEDEENEKEVRVNNNNSSSKSRKKKNSMWVEKYRPKTLDEVLSQEHVVRTVKKLVERNRLPHLLFYGKPGTGKTSSILAIARTIYGDNYSSYVMELNASDERGIDTVRDRVKIFASTRKLFSKGFKLVILDEADHMTKDAQNALRRIVEKWTRNTRFCMICNYVNNIIPALRSRCTQFRFAPLSRKLIMHRLSEIAKLENVNMSNDGLQSVMRLSKGDMRRCLHIMQSTHLAFGEVNEKNVYLQVGQPSRIEMREITDILLNRNLKDAFEEVSRRKKEKGLSIQDIIDYLFAYTLSLKMKDTVKMFLIEKLSDIEYNSLSLTSEKLSLSAVIGIFQVAKKSIVKNISVRSIWKDENL